MFCALWEHEGLVGTLGGTTRVGLFCLVFHPNCLIPLLI